MKRIRLVTCLWVLLCLVSLLGLAHSLRSGAASLLYYRSRYVLRNGAPAPALRLAHRAQTLYPHNYLLAISAGKRAFYAGRELPDGAGLMREARYWSDVAYALCPFNSEATHLRAEVLARDALPEAVALWERYRERVFWEPFNHWMMVDLYVRARDWDKAAEALYWLKDSPLFEPAEDMILNAQRAQPARGP